MGRSYPGYRENISTSLRARSPCYKMIFITLRSYETKVFPGTEISLADRRDLGDRDNFCLI